MSSNESVTIEIDRIVRDVPERDNAMLVAKNGEEVWIPYSQISEIVRNGPVISVRMTTWIARQKGLI